MLNIFNSYLLVLSFFPFKSHSVTPSIVEEAAVTYAVSPIGISKAFLTDKMFLFNVPTLNQSPLYFHEPPVLSVRLMENMVCGLSDFLTDDLNHPHL